MTQQEYDYARAACSQPSVSKTDSGYWHVRWNTNQWIQWPIGRQAELADAFGWVDQQMVDEANRLTASAAKGGAA